VKIVGRFEIPFYQYLDENSQLVAALPEFAKNPQELLELYRLMVLTRLFDQKAITLQRTGKLGTYPSAKGQEAVFIGIGHALKSDDIFVPYYRDFGALIQHGAKLSDVLLYWGGDERGNTFASSTQSFPYSVPVGSQVLYAAGAAAALKYQGKKQAVLCTCGDGATSQGDFYEAINVAGAWQLPFVMVVCNNAWAISVPRTQQTAAETIAQKAIAGGIYGEQVDGNDIIAVKDRIAVALDKARSKQQASVLELICYRHSDHTTADDASRYEPKEYRQQEWAKEPIMRLRRYLNGLKLWDDNKEEQLLQDCAKQIEIAVEEYLHYPPPDLSSIFNFLYAKLPKAYEDQRESLEYYFKDKS
jgi:2-oxoisovalerate dehydrogenase E1 component alpha subunit